MWLSAYQENADVDVDSGDFQMRPNVQGQKEDSFSDFMELRWAGTGCAGVDSKWLCVFGGPVHSVALGSRFEPDAKSAIQIAANRLHLAKIMRWPPFALVCAAALYGVFRLLLDVCSCAKIVWRRCVFGPTKMVTNVTKLQPKSSSAKSDPISWDSVYFVSTTHKVHLYESCIPGKQLHKMDICKNCTAKFAKEHRRDWWLSDVDYSRFG